MEQKLTLRKDTASYTEADIMAEIVEWAHLFYENNIADLRAVTYTVKISSRMTTTHGSCQRIKPDSFIITIGKNYLLNASPEAVHQTIAHEVIHSIPGCYNHKELWKAKADIANKLFKGHSKIERTTNDQKYDKFLLKATADKVKVECQGCHRSWGYKKMTPIVKSCMRGTAHCVMCKSHDFKVFKDGEEVVMYAAKNF